MKSFGLEFLHLFATVKILFAYALYFYLENFQIKIFTLSPLLIR